MMLPQGWLTNNWALLQDGLFAVVIDHMMSFRPQILTAEGVTVPEEQQHILPFLSEYLKEAGGSQGSLNLDGEPGGHGQRTERRSTGRVWRWRVYCMMHTHQGPSGVNHVSCRWHFLCQKGFNESQIIKFYHTGTGMSKVNMP